jgi:hypothetical protein
MTSKEFEEERRPGNFETLKRDRRSCGMKTMRFGAGTSKKRAGLLAQRLMESGVVLFYSRGSGIGKRCDGKRKLQNVTLCDLICSAPEHSATRFGRIESH